MREEIENDEDEHTTGEALDFYSAKQTILSSYFQMINLMILKRINGIGTDYQTNLPSNDLIEEFGLEQDSEIWGTSR